MEKKELLVQHNAFALVRSSTIDQLIEHGEFQRIDANQTICNSGETAKELFFVLDGFISLYDDKKRHVMKMTGKQAYFGWNEYEKNYAFTVKSLDEPVEIFRIAAEKIQDLYEKQLQFKTKLFPYRIPLGAHQFFRTFNIPNFNLDQDGFLTAFKIEHRNADEYIVKKGDEATKFYMIGSGSAKVNINAPEDEEKTVATLNRGQYFGEIALLKKTTRTASVIATTDMTVISISKSDFDTFIGTAKGKYVEQYMLERVNSYNNKLEHTIIGSDENCKPRLVSDKIAPKHVELTRAEKKGGTVHFTIKPLTGTAQYKTFVNKQLLEKERDITASDEVAIGDYKLVLDHRGGFSLQKADYYHLHLEQLRFQIKDKVILDDISFETESGDLVAVMGPSGSGKSTLLDMIYGSRRHTSGNVNYNNDSLQENLDFFRNVFAFVPQDDILFPELSVYENLYFTARIREPLASREKLEEKIDFVLHKLKLLDQKHSRVGSVEEKGLSGGQRKRVNIARELIFDPHVLFLDEPTSGLSSKDSEDIIEILKNLSDMGKMIFVVMHQPSSKIYNMFNKIVFLDSGGKLVFFGNSLDCIKYMKEAIEDQEPEKCPTCNNTQPEILFDVLETRDENNKRKFSPDFWAKRFKEQQNIETVKQESDTKKAKSPKVKLSFKEHFLQFFTLLHRVFLIKKNDLNNLILAVSAPLIIALLLALILSSSGDAEKYTFFDNKLIIIYMFVGVIFSIFLGLTNSVRDIVSEKAIYNLEHKNRLQIPWYVLSKFVVLSGIAAIQAILFVFVGNTLLEVRGVFFEFSFYLFLVSILGVAFGLFLSSIVNSSESVVNWIPLILIPQIILGGALIKFEDMSRNLFINAEAVIPEAGQIIPSRWAHEAMIIAQVESNPHNKALSDNRDQVRAINRKIRELKSKGMQGEIEKLRKKRSELNEERGKISERFPTELYRNKTLQEAAFNGLGTYASTKYKYLASAKASAEFLFIRIYDLPENTKIHSLWNGPFYSQFKGFVLGSRYYEIKTSTFNMLVLLVMIFSSLLLCIGSLKLRDLKKH